MALKPVGDPVVSGTVLERAAIQSPNFQNVPGPAWSFATSGTPTANDYFIVTTSQAASITVGNVFTDTKNHGVLFQVSAKGLPAFGFVNVFFSPNSVTSMNADNVIQSLQSGWAIMQNGNAYFFNIVAQGTVTATSFIGTDFVINAAGAFFYNGTPANGNLFCSIAAVAGTDGFSNAYGSGVNVGNQGGAHLAISTAGDLLVANAANLPVAFLYHGDGSLRFYSPAGIVAGNLAATGSPVAGTDSAGNAYQSGFSVYGSGANAGKTVTLQINAGGNPGVIFLSGKPEEDTAANFQLNVNNIGLVNEFLHLFLTGPQVTTYTDYAYVDLQSSSKDGTGFAGGNLQYIDRSAVQHTLLEWGQGGVVRLGSDGVSYNVSRALYNLAANFPVTSTPAFITGLSQAVSASNYMIHADLLVVIGGTATALQIVFGGPALGAATNVKVWASYEAGGGESVFAGHSIGSTATTITLPSGANFPIGATVHIRVDAFMVYTAAGTMSLDISTSVAATTATVSLGSTMEVTPQ